MIIKRVEICNIFLLFFVSLSHFSFVSLSYNLLFYSHFVVVFIFLIYYVDCLFAFVETWALSAQLFLRLFVVYV